MWNGTTGVDSIDAIYVNDKKNACHQIFKCLKYFANLKKDNKTIDIFLKHNYCFVTDLNYDRDQKDATNQIKRLIP